MVASPPEGKEMVILLMTDRFLSLKEPSTLQIYNSPPLMHNRSGDITPLWRYQVIILALTSGIVADTSPRYLR